MYLARLCRSMPPLMVSPLTRLYPKRVSTLEAKPLRQETGFVKKTLQKLPFFNIDKTRIRASGYLIYEAIADRLNYLEFFEELNVPDTFYSWFVITELHVWMVAARALAEGDDGRLLRNSIVEAMWSDVNQRVKKLGAHNPAVARLQVMELSEQLQAALIAYDEGLQSDDTTLAGALWRRFYQQQDIDPCALDLLVKYIRKQIRILDHLSKAQLFDSNSLTWESLK